MDVQLETPGGLVRQIRVRIPADRVAKSFDDRLKQVAQRARVAGFRPGKAPLKVIEQQFGASVRMEAVQDLVRGSYPEALDKAGVNPASAPSFEVVAEKPGEPLEYVARFEVYPQIELKGLEALKIERPAVEVTEADVEKMIESLRKSRRELENVTRGAADGDVVTIDFEGFLDDVAFEGGKAEESTVEIGRGQFIADLEKGLIGHAPGETFDVMATFPADYRAENLKGKTARFHIAMKAVKAPKLPELNEEFFVAHGVEAGKGLEGLKDKIRTALTTERDKAVRNAVKSQALDQLLEQNPIPLPEGMVAQETQRLRDETASRFNAAQMKPEQKQKMFPDELLAPGARRRVALGLLIGEIIKTRKILLEQPRMEKVLDELAADYQQPEMVKQHYRNRPELMQGVRAMVLEEQVVDALISGAAPSEKAMSLDELLNPPKK